MKEGRDEKPWRRRIKTGRWEREIEWRKTTRKGGRKSEKRRKIGGRKETKQRIGNEGTR